MNIAKTLCALLLALAFGQGYAQEVASKEISWYADAFKDVATGTVVNKGSEFVTRPGTIRWTQKGGAHVDNFVVTGTSGTWTDTKRDGTVVFAVTLEGKPGEISIARVQGEYKLLLTYHRSGQEVMQYEFYVSQVTVK